MDNEGVLKLKDDQFTFAKAIQVAQGTEEVARVAKETAYRQNLSQFTRWNNQRSSPTPPRAFTYKAKDTYGEVRPAIFQAILWQVWEEEPHW